MNEQPLSEEDLRGLVADANAGAKVTVYLCWCAPRGWIVTRVWLTPRTTIDRHRMGNIAHDYNPDDTPRSTVAHCNPDWAYYDNYWFAYRHVLLKNKEREHA